MSDLPGTHSGERSGSTLERAVRGVGAYAEQQARFPQADERQRFNESIRSLLDRLVTDLISTSRDMLIIERRLLS